MPSTSIHTVANAPWGRKRFLLSLPILSVLLIGTALASPGHLRITVNVFNDSNLTIVASVQNVVHPDGPDGKLVGFVTVTNHGTTDTRLTVATARIESLRDENTDGNQNGNADGRLVATITIRVPLLIPAGGTVKVPFSGSITGSVLDLRFGDSFRVSPTVTWFSVSSSGTEQGPFTYAQAKTCTVKSTPLPNSVWTTTTVCA